MTINKVYLTLRKILKEIIRIIEDKRDFFVYVLPFWEEAITKTYKFNIVNLSNF